MPQKLSDIGESGIIKLLKNSLGLDIGDDCAYTKIDSKFIDNYLVTCTDAICEEVHIPPAMSWEQIGKKSATVNLSDIASMGAEVYGFLLSVGCSDILVSDFESMIIGAKNQVEKFGGNFLGGDIVRADKLFLDGAAIGLVKKPILRSGARSGDLLCVTGTLGDAALGWDTLTSQSFSLFKRKLNYPGNSNYRKILKKVLEPEPRVFEGMVIGKYATAMMDISDGLAPTVSEIAKQSKCGFEISKEKIPISEAGKIVFEDFKNQKTYHKETLSQLSQKSIIDYALYGGEDYELLFTIPSDKISCLISEFKEKFKTISFNIIGQAVRENDIVIVDGGMRKKISLRGYEHF